MATVLEPNLARSPGPESSDRSFGFVFAVVFALIGCWPLIAGSLPRWWALGFAGVFALIAAVRLHILQPLNRAWLALGRLLHRVVSPIVMAAIFFLCVTPIGWIMRWRGKDLLSLARHPDLATYWIVREPSAFDPQSMKNQF
jgi:hypothetical protein